MEVPISVIHVVEMLTLHLIFKKAYFAVVVSKRSMSKIGFFHFLIVSWSTYQNELVTKRNTQIGHFVTCLE